MPAYVRDKQKIYQQDNDDKAADLYNRGRDAMYYRHSIVENLYFFNAN